MSEKQLRVVVLISGRGSNLQSLIKRAAGDLPAEIVGVISNRPRAAGLARADKAGIPTVVIDHADFESRAGFEAALQAAIDNFEPGLVVLAGFMRKLGDDFVAHYPGRMINIHPSLLPAFRGLDTHERALEAGVKEHGCSVHFVTEKLDGGPIIAQMRVRVEDGDDPEALAARVLTYEHELLPAVVHWFAEGRLRINDGGVEMDGMTLMAPALLEMEAR
ncbi:MAG: phosphoribosylglycinamide formyltransferase [Gammaproteobacteria bacterium]|nr:MAG: phosphoribosylglycinamide formyltransferase [Gammaproteobacteria bacterium]